MITSNEDVNYDANFGYFGFETTFSPALYERIICSEQSKELQEVQVGLEQMILEPGEFVTWSNAIRERTTSFGIDTLKIVVEMMIQLAAFTSTSPTVQYNLAKLCSFLCCDFPSFPNDMIDCFLFFHQEKRSNLNDQQRLNLLLFFAEVYEKLEAVCFNVVNFQLFTSLTLQGMETAVLEQMQEIILADRLDDSKVKVVVEVLKLTGRYLDANEGVSRINELLTQLNAIAKAHPAISDCVKEQIRSLNTWRDNKWDARNIAFNKEEKHQKEQTSEENDKSSSPSCSSVIIGPDGQPLTEEERAFLEENICKIENDDDDISDEYDEFLSTVADEEAKKCLAEMEVDGIEKLMAVTNLNDLRQHDTTNIKKDREI
ncbi:unnamed protein product [Thelazia callipaeda]|uniref:MIF4G domain-containing protein n=1 Tax=Thelazia callipaeda TaxID=103827 RepID=A0A0N5D0U2_THECL|nr:unnamed protein product [Thelazia callipaeda]